MYCNCMDGSLVFTWQHMLVPTNANNLKTHILFQTKLTQIHSYVHDVLQQYHQYQIYRLIHFLFYLLWEFLITKMILMLHSAVMGLLHTKCLFARINQDVTRIAQFHCIQEQFFCQDRKLKFLASSLIKILQSNSTLEQNSSWI